MLKKYNRYEVMKIFLAFVVTILLCFPAIAQNKTARQQANLNGSVKTVEAYRIEFSFRDGKTEQAKRLSWYSNSFNSKGDLTERVTYNHLGEITEKIVYSFDKKGRNTGYDEYHTIRNKIIIIPRKHIYTLDDKGNRIEYGVFESNGNPASRFIYRYDSKGNKIEYSHYYHTGQIGGTTVYTYDKKGNQISEISYNPERVVTWKIISTYDAKGNETERLQYERDNLKYKIVSRYDNKQRILEKETTEFNATPNSFTSHAPIPGKVIYAYDDTKRTKEVATYKPDGTLVERIIYTYDSRDNEIEYAMFKGDDSPNFSQIQFYDNTSASGVKLLGSLSGKSVKEYEYDSHDNWTKITYLIQSEEGVKPTAYYAEERVITYY